MNFCIRNIALLMLVCAGMLRAQLPYYPDSGGVRVSHVNFNSYSSEFSPFMYDGKLYFVSDREYYFGVVTFRDHSANQFFDVYSAVRKDSTRFEKPQRLPAPVNSKLNDGPVCLTNSGMYFTCNNENAVQGKKRKSPLQLMYARRNEDAWSNPEKISFQLHDTVSVGQAFVLGDTMMYLVSDMDGGFGGTDIYTSRFQGGAWQKPVNCGPQINGAGNDQFPFFHNGVLYFSSNRKGGFGGYDIYSSDFLKGSFSAPRLLGYPVNSSTDDFGFYLDSRSGSGYFSSDRDKTDDVFYFSYDTVPAFYNCRVQKMNEYCFTFFEESAKEDKDTSAVYYEWSFGDGTKARGAEVYHCFEGAGKYLVELNVIEKASGIPFYNQLSYEFNLQNEEQLYIDMPDTVKEGMEVDFNYSYSYVPWYRIEKAMWDFGDGKYAYTSRPRHSYDKAGEYTIQFGARGLLNNKVTLRCVTRKLTVLPAQSHMNISATRRIPKYKSDTQAAMSRVIDSILTADLNLYTYIRSRIQSSKADVNSVNFVRPPFNQNSKDSSLLSYTDPNDPDRNYRVHIGTSDKPLSPDDPVFKGLDSISEIKTSSLYQYFYGKYKSPKMALSAVQKVRDLGFSPYLFPFENDSLSGINSSVAKHLFGDTLDVELDSFTVVFYFKFDDFHLDKNDRRGIERLVERVCKKGCEFVLSGYADSKGTDDYNMELSKKRLNEVSSIIQSKGVDSSKITIRPIGKIRIAEHETDAIRSQERKVEIKVIIK